MTTDECLRDHAFARLFHDEFGWDRPAASFAETVAGRGLTFHALAQQNGVQAAWCRTDRAVLSDRGLLRRIQNVVAGKVHEHVLILTSEEPAEQVWMWAARRPDGRRRRHRDRPFASADPPPAFVERLYRLRLDVAAAGERDSPAAGTIRTDRRTWYAIRSEQLARTMQQGDAAAFDDFILLHRPLARSLSRCLRRWFNLPAEDAEQIGILGVMAAAKRFDPDRGVAFGTYAQWWVRQVCQRYGPREAMLVYLPPQVFWSCYRHAIHLSRIALADGPLAAREATDDLELLNPRLAARWRGYLRARSVGSLADRDTLLQARSIPTGDAAPGERLAFVDTLAKVRVAIGRLHPRHAEIVRRRFGIDGPPETLVQVGASLNLTRERIRQIEVVALEKLRRWLRSEVPDWHFDEPPAAKPPDEDTRVYSPFIRPAVAPVAVPGRAKRRAVVR